MPTFMSRINFVLSWVEHEKSFITLRPDITDKHHGHWAGKELSIVLPVIINHPIKLEKLATGDVDVDP